MRQVVALYRSSVGKKILMAVTGFVWFGYLVAHMAGNLKAFQGADAFNEYAHHLRELGAPLIPEYGFLWAFRAFLLAAFVVHVWLAWETSRQSRAARETRYRRLENLNFDFASSTMRWGGVLILVFVAFHLLHLTTGTVHPDFDSGGPGRIPDAYHNLVTGLSSPLVAGFYALAMVAVCLHLYHGLWSMFQSVGADHPKYAALRRPFAVLMALVVFLGFISIPIAVLTGVVTQ